MQKAPRATNKGGFSLVEVMLALSIFAILAVAFTSSYIYGIDAAASSGNRVRASMLALEGLEAARNIRDADFAELADGTHGLAVSNNQWLFSGTEDVEDIFTRSISISSVDPKRKNIVSSVSWQQGGNARQVAVRTRLADWSALAADGTITVTKTVINTLGSKTPADFVPYRVDATDVNLGEANPFPPGVHTVSETTDPLYSETFSGDCDGSGSITIDYEENKVCAITNQEI